MADKPAFQVIVLGPTGGPREDLVTGILARSTSTQWSLNSMVAVDAGTLFAGITRIFERCKIESRGDDYVARDGPFIGLSLPDTTARANAGHVIRNILGTILITHPHLDHLSALAINSQVLEAGSGPKAVAALPSVLTALKNHLFNDVIWPNMSDEDGGAGLYTYQRLVDGGNLRFGRGETLGYVQACDGLLTKCLSVSHGHQKLDQNGGASFAADPGVVPSKTLSLDHADEDTQVPAQFSGFTTLNPKRPGHSITESSAFFLLDHHTRKEIIIFGDVEPDSISRQPRNQRVWEIAAPKIANGVLGAIFIECSYSDSVDDAFLYGHLCPRHLITELSILASKTEEIQESKAKFSGEGKQGGARSATTSSESKAEPGPLRLAGLVIYIIHIKESVTGGPPPDEQILQELRTQAEGAKLGCDFHTSSAGEDIWI